MILLKLNLDVITKNSCSKLYPDFIEVKMYISKMKYFFHDYAFMFEVQIICQNAKACDFT